MAIPEGTTARQIETLTRAALIGVVVVGMLTWWWPGYYAWGALGGGLLVVLVMWLWRQIVAGDRSVPGHPLHLVLLVPAGILTVHLSQTGLGRSVSQGGMGGAINASMIYQISLGALALVMMQSLLSGVVSSSGWVSACGLAMLAGPTIAMISRATAPVAEALALQAMAGAAVWLSPIWTAEQEAGAKRRPLMTLRLVVAAAAAVVLVLFRPGAAGVAGVAAACGLMLAAVVLSRRPVVRVLCGLGLVAAVGGGVALCRDFAAAGPMDARFWMGRGETALTTVARTASGVRVAVAVIGWGPAVLTMAGAVGSLVCLTSGARALGSRRRAGVAAWMVAAVLGGASMLAGGGAFLASGLLTAALTWSLLPAAAGRPKRRRHGVWLLAGMLAVTAVMGFGRDPGLAQWSVAAFGGSKDILHLPAGFLLATLLAWLAGSRRLWGLAMIVLAVVIGALAELVQSVVSVRGVEFGDWALHTAGCAAAAGAYVLCIAARGCESSLVRRRGSDDAYGSDHAAPGMW